MANATYVLEIDWNNDDDFSDVYEAVTTNVISIETRRGRDYASQLTGRTSPGRLIAVLKNPSGLYSSYNTLSPLYGSILPGRKVRLRTTAPVASTLWTGVLSRITPTGSNFGVPTVQLEAIGPLARLNYKSISAIKLLSQTTGAIMDEILDQAGWPAGERSIDTGEMSIDVWYENNINAFGALREIEETELGFIYEDKSGYFVFEDRHHRLTGSHIISQQTYSDAPAASMSYTSIEQIDALDEIYNEVIVGVQSYTIGSAVTTLWTLDGETLTVKAGYTSTIWAEYPNVAVDTNSGALVDTWTTPVKGVDLVQSDTSYSDLDVVATKFANSMKIAITNNSAVTVTFTLVRARGIKITKNTAVTIQNADADSISKYGTRTYKLPSKWLQSTLAAEDYAAYIIGDYKDPSPKISLRYIANKNSTSLLDALEREISDRVTVTATGALTELGISNDFFVEAIAHRISNGGQLHEIELTLSSAGAAEYWIIGTSLLGTTTKLAF
ncbi:hypothetical protein [Acidaminobacter hydrogenoformans]|uniref:Phage minor structural protein, N-terminal region n=1 Tax=Acidaminobacter hydrogenoformans DSM 2784 TaxID=1120920 RepID=A0A1G5S2M1_9FIRM|nr:hypothetical protein [Acidaminobacter hydrogenoformans]SCZ80387.1 hypothetical protein SAMN03080599_02244 [Acidaminobacter hydrogenoformans DSM 2784]